MNDESKRATSMNIMKLTSNENLKAMMCGVGSLPETALLRSDRLTVLIFCKSK